MATYRIEVTGINELFSKLKKAEEKSLGIAALGLYEGAGIVADAVSQEVRGISTAPFKYAKNGEKRKPSPEEKAAIVGSAYGVAKFKKRLNVVDTSVGFNNSGYVNVNFRHMSTGARTNYKKVTFKGHESNSSSFLREINRYTGGSLGKGAQNQKPVGVIANAINSGTSFMEKQPFITKAFRKSKSAAQAAIEAGIAARIKELDID